MEDTLIAPPPASHLEAIPAARPVAGRELSPSPVDYAHLLYRHKWLVLVAVTLSVLVTYILSARLPRLYEAAMTLDVSNSAEQYVATQIQLLKSAAAPTTGHLQIFATPGTSLVRIAYRASDPAEAAAVVNRIQSSYLDLIQRERFASWRGAAATSEAQVNAARVTMERSEQALHAAEHAGGAAAVADRSIQLNAAYARAIVERANKQAAYDAVQNGAIGALLAAPSGDALKNLIERRNEARQRFSGLKPLFGENHPEYQRTQAQLKELEEQVNAARQTVIQRALSELKEAQARESSLREETAKTKVLDNRVSSGLANYQRLKLKAEEDRGIYEALLRKLREAELEARLQPVGVRAVLPAKVGDAPVSPQIWRNCVMALLFAFLFSTTLVLLFDAPDVRLRGLAEVRAVAPVDVVGVLPPAPGHRGAKPGPRLLQAAAIENLRDIVLDDLHPGHARAVLIASPRRLEGRSTVAANLAVACAGADIRVLLIDADVRKPALGEVFTANSALIGFSNVIRGGLAWRDAVAHQAAWPSLDFIPGGMPSDPPKTDTELDLAPLLNAARSDYDLILFDSPSFLENPEAVDLALHCDSALVIVRARETTESALLTLFDYLRRLQTHVLGVVLNEA